MLAMSCSRLDALRVAASDAAIGSLPIPWRGGRPPIKPARVGSRYCPATPPGIIDESIGRAESEPPSIEPIADPLAAAPPTPAPDPIAAAAATTAARQWSSASSESEAE